MEVKKILLTFDYELFLGNPSGHLEASLIHPTEKILSLLKRYQAKAVFFIDVPFLLRCRKDSKELFEQVSSQIHQLYHEGHEVGLHLHPHWMDAEFKNQQWTFKSFEKFRLHALQDSEVMDLFLQSFNVMKDITGNKDFQFVSFRAGGWCLQPFSFLKKHFEALNIKIDSSVLSGMSKNIGPHFYDFTLAPKKDIWKFSEDPLVENHQGNFHEIPATTVRVCGWELVVNKILLKILKNKSFGDGQGIDSAGKATSIFKRIFMKSLRNYSIEHTSLWLLQKMLKRAPYQTLVFVAHPKSISDLSLKNLEWLLKKYHFQTFKEFLQYE